MAEQESIASLPNEQLALRLRNMTRSAAPDHFGVAQEATPPMATNESTPNTYKCADCGGVFSTQRSDDDAEREAEHRWGVKNAATHPGMAVVCDDCFKAINAERGLPETLDGLHNLVGPIISRAEAIERDKNGKALTEDEAKTLRANGFLRKIAPYLFE